MTCLSFKKLRSFLSLLHFYDFNRVATSAFDTHTRPSWSSRTSAPVLNTSIAKAESHFNMQVHLLLDMIRDCVCLLNRISACTGRKPDKTETSPWQAIEGFQGFSLRQVITKCKTHPHMTPSACLQPCEVQQNLGPIYLCFQQPLSKDYRNNVDLK